MDHNLVPPFFLRKAGLISNNKTKIHCKDASVDDHSFLDEGTGLRIHVTLIGMFSVFEYSSLTDEEIENSENYLTMFLTPDSNKWDIYDESYKLNEDLFLVSRGDMVLPYNTSKHTLVMESDILTVGPKNDTNDISDVHVATIDTVTHSSSSTHSEIPQPQEWVQIREVLAIDAILSTSVVAS